MNAPGPEFDVGPLKSSTVQFLHLFRDEIDMSPPYQRQGDVWSRDRQQLLIDSILNSFDVPKFYLHQFTSPRKSETGLVRYALIDGKQRLDAIFSFLDGSLALSDDFVHIESGSSDLSGANFSELQHLNPRLATRFQSYYLDVVVVRTDDLELIEEMFSRLNEAVPLNAAEKRNARGGPLPDMVRSIAGTDFFTKKIPFTNRRYRHYDLAAKFLYWAHSYRAGTPIARDVKKARLDAFFDSAKRESWSEATCGDLLSEVETTLSQMCECFEDEDELIRNIGMTSVYFLLWHDSRQAGRQFPVRSQLVEFESERKGGTSRSENEVGTADLVYAEFARLAQSPNDAGALTRRLQILTTWIEAKNQGSGVRAAVGRLYMDE